jgi:hypothetical protein
LLTQFVGFRLAAVRQVQPQKLGTKKSIMVAMAWYAIHHLRRILYEYRLAFLGAGFRGGDGARRHAGLSRSLSGDGAQGAQRAVLRLLRVVSSKFAGLWGGDLWHRGAG